MRDSEAAGKQQLKAIVIVVARFFNPEEWGLHGEGEQGKVEKEDMVTIPSREQS